MQKPRYTYVWWGDGYFVYDGDKYIGKDDQVDLEYMAAEAGLIRRVDAEEYEPDYGCATLTEFLTSLGLDSLDELSQYD